MSLRKADKGCIIFNTDKQNGYKIAVVDYTNSSNDAHHWVDNLLHVANCNDNYHNILQIVDICTSFIRQFQKNSDNLTCAKTTVDLLSSVKTISLEKITEALYQMKQQKLQFNTFKSQYEEIHGTLPD